MDREMLYNIIYALAAENGREAALFGNCAPYAREAFLRSLVGDAFPELWFEIPLAGNPWFDFHALVSRKDVAEGQSTFAGYGGRHADALAWFAAQSPMSVRQLALSFDTHAHDLEHPAVQLLLGKRDMSVALGFLEVVGRLDAKDSYRTFVESIPREWYACYVGTFPGRETLGANKWVRVECIVGDVLQRAYANDAAKLREHLALVGLGTLCDSAMADIQDLARTPFPLEFQFNVGPDGKALPTLSASARFQPADWDNASRQNVIGRLAGWLQSRDLADGRCALLPQTVFAKRVTRGDFSTNIYCYPAFVKLRWREGMSPDAKAYLIAGIQGEDLRQRKDRRYGS